MIHNTLVSFPHELGFDLKTPVTVVYSVHLNSKCNGLYTSMSYTSYITVYTFTMSPVDNEVRFLCDVN